MRYRHLFLERDNTLWDVNANSRAVMTGLYEAYGLSVYYPSAEAFYAAYKRHHDRLWMLYGSGRITKTYLNEERFRAPLREAGPEAEALAAALQRDFIPQLVVQTALMPGAREFLEACRRAGYRMYIVSNGFKEVQYAKLAHSGLEGYFRQVFLSEEIGQHKPAKAYFDRVVQSANARKRESLVIGDHFAVDIEGARRAGIDQCFCDPTGCVETAFEPTYRVRDLREMLPVLAPYV